MGEQRQIRSRFLNRMPTKRCTANGIMNEFIVVDDDDVIILDFPESSKGKAPETSRTRDEPVLQRVISIDDDDDDDTEHVHKDGSSSSRNSDTANLHTSVEVDDDDDDDDCQFVQEKCASFRFSKCNQASSAMPSSGTRFGLDSDSDSDFSESDCSDCEILEGSQGEVREQWEKAFLEKMKKAGKAGLSEEAGPSNIHCDANFRPGFESRTEQDDQTSSFFTARNADIGKETFSAFFETEKTGKAGWSEEAGPSNLHGNTNSNPGFESRHDQHEQTSSFFTAKNFDGDKETSSTIFGTEKSCKAGAGLSEEAGLSGLHCDTNFRSGFESRAYQHDQPPSFTSRYADNSKERSSTFFRTEKSGKAGRSEEDGLSELHCGNRTEQHDQSSSFFTARNPDGGKETSSTFFGTDNRNPKTPLFGSEMEGDNLAEKCANSSFFSKEDFAEPSSLSPEIQVEHERSSNSPTTDSTSSKEQTHQNSFKGAEEQPDTVPLQCETSEWPEENQKKKEAEKLYTKEVVQEEDASKSSPPHTSDEDGDTPPVLGVSNGGRCEGGISSLGESREPIIDPIPSTSEQVQGLQGTAPEIDIMLNREMLKETDEYKKAQEEEWESRQRQLQLQAEEAQRQRKRRKLANTRQLEMERRQKERVEEVRETQKKDEESMNMKEKIRAEINKSLKLLEIKCINMASLLRGLGIPVNGGISPPPQEVHAAYKRAVLKFHPDRASRGDIKQQVEAEEKFKLIARMKEKFLS